MAKRTVCLDVDAGSAGRTVAALLRDAASVSHAVARGLIDRGLVTLNGRMLRDPAHRARAGDRIEAGFDPGTRYRARGGEPPRGSGFRVIVEDDDLLVVDKDAGIVTVPAPSHPTDTLVDRLLRMYAARGHREPRLWVIHRIDRYTSGLVLFARSDRAFAPLADQFRRRQAAREYLAICVGTPAADEGRLDSWLVENPRSLKVTETDDHARGRRATASYRVEETLAGAALLRVTLETGRRHQIRVQLAGIGHPLVGDRAYGKPSDAIGRVALHAARIAFAHPATGRTIRVESPLPPDMRRALRRLRQAASP